MKKILLFVFSILGMVALSSAKEVKPEAAKLISQNMYQQVHNEKGNLDFQLVYTSVSKFVTNTGNSDPVEVPLFYVFNAGDDNGFVIVSGDDNAIPILGYTTSGDFDYAKLPDNFKKWLEGYKNQMRFIITNNVEATEDIASKWKSLEAGQPLNSKGAASVNPLLTVTWSQSPYVNDMCPYDPQAGPDNGYHAVTGCPATAMAQIMKFWNYPAQGTGFHSYNHTTYGTLSANFASTTYDWAAMPGSVNGPNDAVATLMYHCGVAVEMEYGPTVSGSYVIMDGYPMEQTCEYAYKAYFGYDASSLQGLKRENYSDNAWIQLLKTDLDAGRPIQYAGFGAGGHTWVCDGYDYDYYFHMNWGWGGYADGYFLVDALNPGSGGTGSGAGTYNNGQQAVFGIKPPNGSASYAISLYDNVVVNPNPVWYGSSFTVHTDIGNFGAGTFNGDYSAAIFDENGSFVDFVEILTGYNLGSNQHYTNGLDFTNPGMITVLPGSYYIGIFYRPTDGDWAMVGDGSYSNLISFSVNYSNDIELYQDIVIDVGTNILQNQPFKVTLDIANDGSSTFIGEFDVSLFGLDGYFAETVQTLTGGNLAPGYFYDDIVFECGGVSVAPGTYLMALMHKADGADWELSGSTYFSNPIYVTIQEQALAADAYENNDTQNDAFSLSVNFTGSSASVATSGSNAHIGSDEDYYKIDLPSGFDYTITARVHDSYNSGNGQLYTCDMSWLYLNGIAWSDTYDDVMPNHITVKNGGTVYFHVAPYFIGQAGTYLLDLAITRTPASGINHISASGNISVHPNPASDFVHIEFEDNITVRSIGVFDIEGKQVFKSENFKLDSKNVKIPVSEFKDGSYMLLIETDEDIWQHKFIKSR
ncbi:MAG: T9SS type A sorting domain-containing protein [Bacteroidales bacterium]|nr:T9SS type A sorting domain-containing protein [Bacteroidales bacterium]